jgi:hypothetical protein
VLIIQTDIFTLCLSPQGGDENALELKIGVASTVKALSATELDAL